MYPARWWYSFFFFFLELYQVPGNSFHFERYPSGHISGQYVYKRSVFFGTIHKAVLAAYISRAVFIQSTLPEPQSPVLGTNRSNSIVSTAVVLSRKHPKRDSSPIILINYKCDNQTYRVLYLVCSTLDVNIRTIQASTPRRNYPYFSGQRYKWY